MKSNRSKHLILGVTGASGTSIVEILIKKSFWPIDLIISNWGKRVIKYENTNLDLIIKKATRYFQNDDLFAPSASGSVQNIGMVILPCSTKTLGEIATGTGENLISRTAHCQLKERRPLIVCFRETPLSSIDINNIKIIDNAGGIVMPICPPFFMFSKKSSSDISMKDLLNVFVDRVLSLLGQEISTTWEDLI